MKAYLGVAAYVQNRGAKPWSGSPGDSCPKHRSLPTRDAAGLANMGTNMGTGRI